PCRLPRCDPPHRRRRPARARRRLPKKNAGAGPAGTGANANRGRHAATSVRAGEERAIPSVACRAAPRRASGSGQRLRVSPERRRAALPAPRPATDRAAAFAAAHSSGSGGLLSRLAGAVPDARAMRPVAGAVAPNVALLGAALSVRDDGPATGGPALATLALARAPGNPRLFAVDRSRRRPADAPGTVPRRGAGRLGGPSRALSGLVGWSPRPVRPCAALANRRARLGRRLHRDEPTPPGP